MGPVDGHDAAAVEAALVDAAQTRGPALVHALTEKGRGHDPARSDQEKRLHDVRPSRPAAKPEFEAATAVAPRQSYTEVFGAEMIHLAREDPRVYAIVAAMPGSTGLIPFAEEFPDRFLDAGIAEQHAVGVAAGMAMRGLRPVVAVFSTFLMRAFDQVNLDVGLRDVPVVFCVDRAGITGSDGPSHNGVLDLALFSKIPGMTIFAPSSGQELREMMRFALSQPSPAVIRFPKGAAPEASGGPTALERRARLVRPGDGRICIVSAGDLLGAATRAAEALAGQSLDPSLWDARSIVPLDADLVAAAAGADLVVTLEEGIVPGGGLETELLQRVGSAGTGRNPRFLALGTPRAWIPQGDRGEILSDLGLDAVGIGSAILKAVKGDG